MLASSAPQFAAGALFGAAALLVAQRLRAGEKPLAISDDDSEPQWLAEAASRLSSSGPASPDRAYADEGEGDEVLASKLLDASKGGDAEEVERLVQMGAKHTATDGGGNSPLHLVCRDVTDPPVACRIISALSTTPGFNVNAVNAKKNTALMNAARCNTASVVNAVAALNGVDPNVVNVHDLTALNYACANEKHAPDVIRALGAQFGHELEKRYYNWDDDGQTVIFWAAEYNNFALAEAILSLQGYSFVEQYRRIITDEMPCMYREPLTNAVIENAPTFIAAVAAHLRKRGEHTAEIVSEIFDTPRAFSTDGKQKTTLVERAASNGLWSCVEELYLAGAAVTMRDLVPTILGGSAGSSMVQSCCERVRQRFLADFAEGDVEVVSVEANAVCPEGLISSFRSSLDIFSSRHGRPPPTRFLWHCSSVPKVVLESGLNGNFASMDLNVYGVGLYMATDAKLSAAYARPDADGVCTMLLVLTVLGKTGVREPLIGVEEESTDDERLKDSMAKMGINLTQPQHRNPPVGCDSATGPHSKELVVYSSSAALPAFAVRYRLKNASMPNPYQADTKSRQGGEAEATPAGTAQYLRSLREVPPLLTASLGTAPIEADLEIVEDAALLPTGTFPTTREEARELRRKVIEEGFSLVDHTSLSSSKAELWAKCVRLGDELGWLKEQLGKLQQVEAENQALRMQFNLPMAMRT